MLKAFSERFGFDGLSISQMQIVSRDFLGHELGTELAPRFSLVCKKYKEPPSFGSLLGHK